MRQRRTGSGRAQPVKIPPRELWPLVPISALVFLAWLGISHSNQSVTRDLEGVSSREGVGTVTRVTTMTGSKAQGNEVRPVSLELDGRPVNLNVPDPTWLNWLHVGQKVTYTYRVGRSGAWYIDQIAPTGQGAMEEVTEK